MDERVVRFVKRHQPVEMKRVIRFMAGIDKEALNRARQTLQRLVLCGTLNIDREWKLCVPE